MLKNVFVSFLGSVLFLFVIQQVKAESVTDESQGIADRRGIEEVIVTATRIESSAQETPVAVTAFGAREREELGLRSIQEIAAFTPGVSYQSNPNRFTIRGVGRQDNTLGSDPGVAIYYDGTYTSETAAIGQIPLFVERTEVLRGPQGTLFGRNAVGGLVNVISRRPASEFSADVQANLNDYGQRFYATSISGPFVGYENFQFRLNAWKQNDMDGYQENLGSGGKVGGLAAGQYVEFQIDSQLSDRLYAWVKLNGVKTDGPPGLTVLRAPYASNIFQGDIYPWPEYGLTDSPGQKDNRTLRIDHEGSAGVRDTNQNVLNIDYSLDWAEIKYLYSNAQYDFFYSADLDGTDRAGFDYPLFDPLTGVQFASIPVSTYLVTYIEENKRYDSHELQLISSNRERVQFIGGLYYYSERIHQPIHFGAPNETALYFPLSAATFGLTDNPNFDGDFYYQAGFLESEQYAVYGQADIAVTDQLNLTVGLRYSTDEKKGTEEQRIVLYNPSILPGLSLDITNNFNGPNSRFLENSWNAVSGKVGLDYQISDDAMIYGNLAKGYKSGGMRLGQFEGYDPFVPTGISSSISPFVEGETLYSFEAGFKTDLFDKLFRINTAVFYYDYNDMQTPVSFIDSSTGLTLSDFINIPKTESYGLELEGTWIPTDSFQLMANYSFMRATVAESLNLLDTGLLVPAEQNVSGNSLPKSPENKLALVGSYYLDTDFGTFTAVANWMYYSEQYSTLFEREVYKIESYALASARLIYNSPDDSLQAIFSISNITNDDTPINSLGISGSQNNFARQELPGAPRIISLEVTRTFGAPR